MTATKQPLRFDLPGAYGARRTRSGEWSKRAVQERVTDWIRRLNRLFDVLDAWVAGIPGATARREKVVQVPEYMMRKVHLPPRELPTYTVLLGKRRVSFESSDIWIIGANGRISVRTNNGLHHLVDLGGHDGHASDWQLMDLRVREMMRPFDRVALLELLRE